MDQAERQSVTLGLFFKRDQSLLNHITDARRLGHEAVGIIRMLEIEFQARFLHQAS